MCKKTFVVECKVSTLAGVDREALWADAGRPPRGALHVVSVEWMWSPAHNDSCTYWLSRDRKQSHWILWEQTHDPDTGKKLYARIAYLEPYRGTASKDAAKQLLLALWRKEEEIFGNTKTGSHVERAGLLDADDVAQVDEALAGDEQNTIRSVTAT
jgi:hypothetical protein